MEKVKILVLGPERSGKTAIVNHVSGFKETTSDYKPTVALRIVEYEASGLNFNKSANPSIANRYSGGTSKASVELWDVSGHVRYQSCWPAIMKDANGILFVVNPEMKNCEKELENWHKSFVGPTRIRDACLLCFGHRQGTQNKSTMPQQKPKLPKQFAKIKFCETSLEYGSDDFKADLDRLVENIVITRREAEENQILDGSSTQ
uniref:Uncharacterized protein n=1 Tax=Eutreptiella gymnastica TaxID=73025 RepID=A0A7S1IVR6_9EUGL|mmetsp:Transcript_47307/g.84636  ORF Transcript_47307/g.84636 Transcript_47307/m.84636 type:complete len:204 (+) Transcript_47307:86-697(+)